MSEQNAQFDRNNGQPDNELSTEDIVSAGQRRDKQPADGMARDAQTSRQAMQERQSQANVSGGTGGVVPQRSTSQDAGATRGAAGLGQTVALSPLLTDEVASVLQTRWEAVQTGFVDEPRRAVEQADSLVADVMKRLADTFAQERAGLERQWSVGGSVSTEELRLALQRYRSFFQRLLSA